MFFQPALEQAQPQQAFGQRLHRGRVHRLVRHARPRLRQRRRLRRADHVVQRALFLAEAPVRGERAGDVRGVAAMLGAGVDQHQVSVADRRVVGDVVQHAGVGARADDATVGRNRVRAAELALEFGLQFVFAHARAHCAHRRLVRGDGDVGGALHQLQFLGRLGTGATRRAGGRARGTRAAAAARRGAPARARG